MFTFALLALAAPQDKPDPLPDGAVARLGSVRLHGPTLGLAFSSDVQTLYTADEKVVHAWDAATGRRKPDIGCPPSDASFKVFTGAVAGGRVVRSSWPAYGFAGKVRGGDLHIYDLVTNKETKLPLDNRLIFAPALSISPPARLSADGRRLAFREDEDRRRVAVYDLATGKNWAADDTAAGAFDLAPDGDTLATLLPDRKGGTVRVWDVPTAKRRAEFTAEGNVLEFRVSAGGGWVVGKNPRLVVVDGKPKVPGPYHSLRVWDGGNGQEVGELALDGSAKDFRFAGPDSLVVYAVRVDADGLTTGTLSRWSVKTLKQDWVTEYTRPRPVGSGDDWRITLAVSPDGKRCAVSDGRESAAVFDAVTGKRTDDATRHDGPVRAGGWSADGTAAYTVGDNDARTWDAASGKLKSTAALPEFRRGEVVGGVVNGTVVCKLSSGSKTEVVGYDVVSEKVVWRVKPGVFYVDKVVSSDGKRVALLTMERPKSAYRVEVYDGPSGKREHAWDWTVGDLMYLVAMSADGERLWAAGQVQFGRDLESKAVSLSIKDGSTAEAAVEEGMMAFTPTADGKTFATLQKQSGVNVTTLDAKPTTRRFTGVKVEAGRLVYSPDGTKLVAVSRGSAKMWVYDLAGKDDQRPKEFDGGGAGATTAAFSPDGTRLAVGYADGTAVVWQLAK